MDKISKTIESSIKYWKRFNKRLNEHKVNNDVEEALALTTGIAAEHTKADAIVAYTKEGESIRKLAGLGLSCPILAITDDEKTYNQLAISANVYPVLCKEGKIYYSEKKKRYTPIENTEFKVGKLLVNPKGY